MQFKYRTKGFCVGKGIKKLICKGTGIYLLFKRLLDNNETHSVRQRRLSSESEIIIIKQPYVKHTLFPPMD